MANPWFRLYSRIINDPKVEAVSFEDQRHYVWLLCLKNEGFLDEKSIGPEMFERMVARKLGLQGEAFGNAKTRLMEVGLIDDRWQPLNIDDFIAIPDRPSSFSWKTIRERIFLRDNYTCFYCGKRGGRLECDHIFPVALGGGHEDENLTTACFICNRAKRSKTLSEWKGGIYA